MQVKSKSNPINTILITGGTGLVGMRLSELLSEMGYTITHLSRSPKKGRYPSFFWDIESKEIEYEAIKSADAIIHLAGAGVADKRWNEERKKDIYRSRIDSTQLLRNKVGEYNPNLRYFLSASAIGYYGWDTGPEWVDETAPKGAGFLADVVADWEQHVAEFSTLSIPFGMVRIGVVLSERGGALVEIAKPIQLLAGAPLGSGKQFMSWIHLDDLCGIFIHMLENGIQGRVNGVAPQPVTNEAITRAIAKALKKPLFLPNVPKFALKILVGEMADMLIGGNKVSSEKIRNLGYSFRFPDIQEALKDLL